MINLSAIVGFEWDAGNERKNEKHGVSTAEAEQIFFNAPLLLLDDAAHSQDEARFHALGQTDEGRQLHISFTLRQTGALIRVISARDMHKRSAVFMTNQTAKQAIPKFKTEAQERAYWESHDSTVHLDWSQAQKVRLPNLRPTTKTISLRLPQHLLDGIKVAANARDVPYQSLIKVWLQEKLHSH